MNVNLQFTVQCSECFVNDVVNFVAVEAQVLGYRWDDAVERFESRGWLRLPSGKWVCGSPSHSRKPYQKEPA